MAINGKWRYEDLTWPEMNEAVEAGLIPVLPVGTMEQHGPHLPVQVDSRLATEVSHRAAQKAHNEQATVVLPVVWAGLSEHHMPFGGTITLALALIPL
mgnify:CR=1 FL=1